MHMTNVVLQTFDYDDEWWLQVYTDTIHGKELTE